LIRHGNPEFLSEEYGFANYDINVWLMSKSGKGFARKANIWRRIVSIVKFITIES